MPPTLSPELFLGLHDAVGSGGGNYFLLLSTHASSGPSDSCAFFPVLLRCSVCIILRLQTLSAALEGLACLGTQCSLSSLCPSTPLDFWLWRVKRDTLCHWILWTGSCFAVSPGPLPLGDAKAPVSSGLCAPYPLCLDSLSQFFSREGSTLLNSPIFQLSNLSPVRLIIPLRILGFWKILEGCFLFTPAYFSPEAMNTRD